MEITLSNFSEQLPNITNDLKNSSYVGFDAEFTAILSKECFKHRYFFLHIRHVRLLRAIMSPLNIIFSCHNHDAWMPAGGLVIVVEVFNTYIEAAVLPLKGSISRLKNHPQAELECSNFKLYHVD